MGLLLLLSNAVIYTLQASIYSVIAGGKVISVGMGCDHAHLPLSTINCKEIDLMGSFRYANTVCPHLHPCLAPIHSESKHHRNRFIAGCMMHQCDMPAGNKWGLL